MTGKEKMLLAQVYTGEQKIDGIIFDDRGCTFELTDNNGGENEVAVEETKLPAVADLIEETTGFNFEYLQELKDRAATIDLSFKWTPYGFGAFTGVAVICAAYGVPVPSKTCWMTLAEFETWLDKVEIAAAEIFADDTDN